MRNIRARFDIIDGLKLSKISEYAELETAAFHLRKSIEGVAFGCLVTMENGLNSVPRDAQGEWSADRIFSKMARQKPAIFPLAVNSEDPPQNSIGVQHHLTENKQHNLRVGQVRSIYRRTHPWLHEMNPYIPVTATKFENLRNALLDDIVSVWLWLLHHVTISNKEIFMTVMKNSQGELEVMSASGNVLGR